MLDIRSSCFFLHGSTVFSRRIVGVLSAHDSYLSFKGAEINFDIPLSKITLAYAFEGFMEIRFAEKIEGRKAIAFYPVDSSLGKPKEVMKGLALGILTLGIAQGKSSGSLEKYDEWQAYFKEKGLGVKGL